VYFSNYNGRNKIVEKKRDRSFSPPNSIANYTKYFGFNTHFGVYLGPLQISGYPDGEIYILIYDNYTNHTSQSGEVLE